MTGRYGTIGEVFFVTEDFWPLNTTLFVKDFHGNDPLFVSYVLRTIDFHSHSGKSGVPGVNRNDLHSLVVRLPGSREEQRAIAAALGDVDALIDSLERLIAKKRDIKQAAMQQLLTGRTRLPGFSGEWSAGKFGDAARLRTERVDPRSGKASPFSVELEGIESGSGRLLPSADSAPGTSLKAVFRPRDILFGKLRAYLRKFWMADRPGICSTEIWVLAADRRLVTPEFLFQVIRTDEFIDAASTSHGTHMPRSDWSVVKRYELRLPPPSEQSAIAAVLSDMDAEIDALERRLAKTRALKQGMMQELLTGRIRLVEAPAASQA